MIQPVRFQHIEKCKYYVDRRLERDRSELKESLVKHGVLQAPVGRLVDEHGSCRAPFDSQGATEAWLAKNPDRYIELAAGHRRVRSVRELAEEERGPFAGESSIEINLKKLSDEELAAVFHQENAERDNVTGVVEAEQWAAMLNDGMTLNEVADLSGTSRVTISKRVRLMNFPQRVREEIDDERSDLTLSGATAIAGVWDLSGEEEEALVAMEGGVRGVREHLLDTARKENLETVKATKRRLVDDNIERYQAAEPDDSEAERAVSETNTTSDEAKSTSSGANHTSPESNHTSSHTSSGDEDAKENSEDAEVEDAQVEVQIEGDLQPGEYILKAMNGNGEKPENGGSKDSRSIGGGQKRKDAVGALAAQIINESDVLKVAAEAFGAESEHEVKVALLNECLRKSEKDWANALRDVQESLDLSLMRDPLSDG
jgi:ParB/RepB/Spo0J family partition protein